MSKKADQLADMEICLLFPFKERTRTITKDNGMELAGHEKVAKKLALHEVVWVAQDEPARLGAGYRSKAPK